MVCLHTKYKKYNKKIEKEEVTPMGFTSESNMGIIMKKSRLKNKFVLFGLSIAMLLGVFGANFCNQSNSNSVQAITNSDTTSYVSVGEIWNSETKSFDITNLSILKKYITGSDSGTIDDINTMAEAVSASDVMRAKTLSEGTEFGVSYSAKSSTQDIVVTLGGLKWQVMYLSQDKSGNSILTLWLSNNTQDAWTSRSSTEGENYGYLNGGLYSNMTYKAWSSSSWVDKYPETMYGTSYINSVVLNNGGYYSLKGGELSSLVSKSSSSAFATFTMEDYGLTDYLVTPRQVSWQESGQSATIMAGFTYNVSNENWSTSIPDDGFRYPYYNYATKSHSDDWADSYLWLPSISEVGGFNASYTGMWASSTTQRQNYDGSSTYDSKKEVGSSPRGSFYYTTALRSDSYDCSWAMTSILSNGACYISASGSKIQAVRPALHLNLNSVEDSSWKKSLRTCEMSISSTTAEYDGQTKSPSITLTCDGETLTENTDYTLSYKLNDFSSVTSIKDAGTYTITATGCRNWQGTQRVTYTVTQRDINNATMSGFEDEQMFHGSVGCSQNVKLSDLGGTLKLNTDYTIAYANEIYVGTATMTITGEGNYTGTITRTYEITPFDFAYAGSGEGAFVEVQYTYNQTYTGSEITPDLELSGGEMMNYGFLTYGTEYTVEYTDNINVGIATITITGMTNFCGTMTCKFRINAKSISSGTLTVADATYNGNELTPPATLVVDGRTLTLDTDYTAEYTNNISAGTGTVTITGIGNYKETISKTFTISKCDINLATVSSISGQLYTGSYITPTPTLTYNSCTLIKDTDYTLGYSDNLNIGTTASVTITGLGNFTGSVTKTFSIVQADISEGTLTLNSNSFVYTGDNITPVETLVVNGATLVKNTDYTCVIKTGSATGTTVAETKNMGTYYVVLTGQNTYSGTISTSFEIVSTDLSEDGTIILSSTKYEYTGSAITPTFQVRLSSNLVVDPTGYTYVIQKSGTIASAINVGTYTLVVTGTEANGYKGSISAEFSIVAKDITNAVVTLSASSFEYTGSEIKPSIISVSVGSLNLTSSDYTATYSNNIGVTTSAQVTLTAKGNFTGTRECIYSITAIELNSVLTFKVGSTSSTNGALSVAYAGSAYTPVLTVTDKNGKTVSSSDYEYSICRGTSVTTNLTDVGEITITVTPKYNTTTKTTNYSGKSIGTLTITRVDMSSAVIEVSGTYEYNNTPIVPTFKVWKDSTKTAEISSSLYSTTLGNNTNAGSSASISVSFTGNYTGSTSAIFSISQRNISNWNIEYTIPEFVYDGTAKTITYTLDDSNGANLTGQYFYEYTNNINAGTATLKLTGTNNYCGTVSKTFEISPQSIATMTISAISNQNYTGSKIEPTVVVKIDDSHTLDASNYTVAYSNNTNVGTAYAIVSGKDNYTGTISAEFEIVAVNISSVQIADIANQTYTMSEISPKPELTFNSGKLFENTDYTLTYSHNTNVGTATITITGMGAFTGTTTKTFKIVSASVENIALRGLQESYTYTGSEINTLHINNLYFNGSLVSYSGDAQAVTVTYSNNTNVGTATLTITPYVNATYQNFTGAKTIEFKISKTDLTYDMITLPSTYYTYTGASIAPEPTVKFGSTTLAIDTDYSLSYSTDTTNVGTKVITIYAPEDSNFEGSVSINYYIQAKSISSVTIADIDSITYTRNELTPNLTVTDGSMSLTKGKDYTVEYSNNTNVGTAIVVIRGKGNYLSTTTKSATFEITPATIDSMTLTATSKVYDRKSTTISASMVSARTLQLNAGEYTLKFYRDTEETSDLTNAGTIVVKVYSTSDNFKIETEITSQFTIIPATISTVTLSTTETTYSKSEQKPMVSKVMSTNNLTLNASEYSIDYLRDNISTSDFVNAGKITVRISSNNSNFQIVDIVESEYDILPKSITDSDIATKYYFVEYKDGEYVFLDLNGNGARVYMEEDQKYIAYLVHPEIKFDGIEIAKGTDYDFTIKNEITDNGIETSTSFVNVGAYLINITAKGNYTGTIQERFKVNAREFTPDNVTVEFRNGKDFEYSGSLINLDLASVLKLTYIQDGITSEIVLEGSVTAGSESASYKLYDAYDEGKDYLEYTDDQGNTIEIKFDEGNFGYINNINAGKAMVFLKGVRNFSGVIGIEFNITPQNINDDDFVFELSDTTSLVYTGKEHKPTLKTHTFSTTNLVENVDYSLTYLNNINAGTAKAIITGRNNFVGTKEIDFVIDPKALTSDMLLTISNVYYNGNEQKPNINLVYNSMSLVEDGDYTISYNTGADFVNANTITITITAKSSNYSGSFDSTYTILPRNLRSIILSSSKSIYNRELHTISFVVMDMDNLIVAQNASNLSVKYYSGETEVTEIINAGTYVIQVSGLNNYTGTLSANYIVSNASVGIEMLTTITDQIYTMNPITPSVSMNYLSQLMQEDTEYTYTIANNTNVGVAEIKVEGVGNFAGSFTAYFNIVAKDLNELTYADNTKLTTNYTGLAVLPSDDQFTNIISFGDYKLELNKDFVIYTTDSSINKGTYNLQIKGIGNYTGVLTKNFEVLAMDISSDNISVSGVVSKTYTGKEITQNFVLTNLLSNSQLYLNSDFTANYSKNINVAWLDGTEDSKAQITITAKGNYTGQRIIYFTILAKDLGSSDIIIASIDPVVYIGSAQTPKPEVKFGETVLGEDIIEYTYLNNIKYGRASVIITAKANTNFKGSVTRYFEIGLTQMSGVTVSTLSDVVYNGQEQKLEPVLTSDTLTLTKDKDYTLSYSSDTTNVGIVTVTIQGKGDFAGVVTTNYKITPIVIVESNVSIGEIASSTFTGKEITPQFEVKYNSIVLTLSKDYTLSYSNNTNVTTEAVASINFIGNYSGITTKKFEITAKTVTLDMVSGLTTQIYTGSAIQPTFEIIYNLVNYMSTDNFTLSYRDNTNVGTAYIDITGKDNFSGSITAEFKIVAKTLTVSDLTLKVTSDCTYSGESIKPQFTVSVGETTLSANDYDYTYGTNINAGATSGEIYFVFKGNYAGNVTESFEILPANVSGILATVSANATYDGNSHTPSVSLSFKETSVSTNDYDIIYIRGSEETVDFVNAGTITIKITGKNNFTGTKKVEFKIASRPFDDVSIGITDGNLIYTGSAIEPEITVAYGTIVLGSDGYTIKYMNNIIASSQAKIIITSNNPNFTGFKEQLFTIQPRTLDVSYVQDIDSVEYSSTEQKPTITVIYNDTALVPDADFSVSYLNNTNVGSANVQITGTGNFTGTIFKQFSITTCSITNAKVEELQNSYTFTNQEIKPTIVLKINNRTLTLGEDYTLDYDEDRTNVGSKSITITGINNYAGTKTVSYSITAKNLNDSEITISGVEDKKYALGAEITQDFMLKHNDNIILMSDSYTVTYTNNTNAGTARITIAGRGNYTGSRVVTFNISKLTPEVVVSPTEAKIYEDDLIALSISNSSTAGKVVTEISRYLAGEHVYNWTFIPTDTVNFESVTGSITLSAIALEVVGLEFDGDYKKDYIAFENLDIDNLVVKLKYNSGKAEIISKDEYVLSMGTNEILKVDSVVTVKYSADENIFKLLPLTISPKQIIISDYAPKFFVESEEKQYISIAFTGEDKNNPITYRVFYSNLTNNTTNEYAFEKGKYRIFVDILDYNYSLQDSVIELEVKSKIINSSDNNLVVEAPNGFGIDESFGYDVIVDKNLALQTLGLTKFDNSNSFVAMYQFELEQNKNIYVTFNPNMSDLSKLQVFKLVNGKLQQVNFSKLQDGKITINCNSTDKLCLFENNNAGVVTDKNNSETDWVLIIVIAVLFVATIAVVFIAINKRQGGHSIKETKSEKVNNSNTNVQPKQTIQEVEHINTNGVKFANIKEENRQNNINNSKNYTVYSSNVINSEDAKLSKSELIKKYVIFENGKVVGVRNGAPAEIINAVRQVLNGNKNE